MVSKTSKPSTEKTKWVKRYGHSAGAPVSMEQRLDFQSGFDTPTITDDFYYSSHNFLDKYKGQVEYINLMHSMLSPDESQPLLQDTIPPALRNAREALKDIKLANFPSEEAYQTACQDAKTQLFQNGYSRFSVIDVSALEKRLGVGETMDIAGNIITEMNQRYSLPATLINIANEKGERTHTLLACAQTKYVQQESGQWIEQAVPDAVPHFMAMAVAKGLATENALRNSGVLLGSKNYVTLGLIKQLKEEGVKPLIEQPLHLGNSGNGIAL